MVYVRCTGSNLPAAYCRRGGYIYSAKNDDGSEQSTDENIALSHAYYDYGVWVLPAISSYSLLGCW